MAELNIGDRQIVIGVLNFKKLKKAWPEFRKAANVDKDDPMASFDHAVSVVEIALEGTPDAMTRDQIEEELKGPQVVGLSKLLGEIMRESGLVTVRADGTAVGNVPGAEEPSPESSTEISIPSSPSLSPQDVKAEAGTE